MSGITIFESILIAIALAMDCLSVSFSCGVTQCRMGRQAWFMAFLFGFFQALMALIGWALADCSSLLLGTYEFWISFVLLFLLGCKMIWDGINPCEDSNTDYSNFYVLVLLSVATSVDALAVGYSFGGMGIYCLSEVALPIFLIGAVSFVMSLVGKYFGIKFGHFLNIPGDILGGIILIIIGLKVLIEHLQ